MAIVIVVFVVVIGLVWLPVIQNLLAFIQQKLEQQHYHYVGHIR